MTSFFGYRFLLIAMLFVAPSGLTQDGLTNPFPMTKVDHSSTTWFLEMNADNPNVLDAEVYFDTYFNLHPTETSHQKRQFIRWLETARLSIDAEGNHLAYELDPTTSFGATGMAKTFGSWRMLGPNFAEETTCGTSSSLSGGFCDRVYINPYNTDNLFAGFSYGGLWVSKDQGATWSLTDAEYGNGTNTYANRDYYYGEIEASILDDALIYAATESGLLKSINGGDDWDLCPELNRDVDPSKRPYFVALSSADEDIVLSTFGRSLYRSFDGGDSWTEVFDNSAGGTNHYWGAHSVNSEFGIYNRGFNFFGLEKDMDDANVYYLGAYNAANDPCIYKSIDGGLSFTLLVNLDIDLGRTLPNMMAFQTIPDSPDQLYIYSLFTTDSIYRYDQTGVLNSKNWVGKTEGVKVNPLNEDNIYTGYYFASSVNRSYDGGLTYTDMTSGYGGCPKYVHPDIRSIDCIGDLVFIGSDGGLAISTDAMESVHTIGREISAIDLWGFSSSPKSDILSAGCDHGPTKIRRFDGDNGWISRGGGDASRTSVNQSHDQLIYYNHGYGKFKTELDDEGNFLYTQSVSTAFRLNTMEFHPNLYHTFYGHNASKVYVSRDNFETETEFHDFGATVNEFRIAPQDSSRMYVLHGNNTVERSLDGGASWTDITPSGVVTEGITNIVGLTVGDSPNELWLAYGNYQNDAKVIHSVTGGLVWSNITTASLPLTPVSEIAHQLGTNGGVYLAFSGNSGVWYKNNIMPDWTLIGTGLPTMGYTTGLFIVPPKGKLRMGSSRGSWEHDLLEETEDPIANFAASATQVLCPVTPIEYVQNCVHSSGEATYLWEFPGGYPSVSSAEKPNVYYATPGSYHVSLTVTDEFGNTDTKTMTGFITMLDNSCPDTDGDGIDDFDEASSCTNLLDETVYIDVADSVLITDFDAGDGVFYISLEFGNKCDSTYAMGEFSVDLEQNKINPWGYQHFGSDSFIDPLTESDSGKVQTSTWDEPAQIALKLLDDQLYLHHIANDCDTGAVRLTSGCWSSIDADGDGIPNSEDLDSDNDGLPDFTENTPCYELVEIGETLSDFDSVLVHTFDSGTSFINISFTEACGGEQASLMAHVKADLNEISVIEYQHFNGVENGYTYEGINQVTSISSDVSKLRFKLIANDLYVYQLTTDCADGVAIDPFCWSSIDYDGDGISNFLDLDSDGDGLTDENESNYCYYESGTSAWFSSGDSTLIADLADIPSTTDQYYVSLLAYTNCYGLTTTLNGVVDVNTQQIHASFFDHFSGNDGFSGNATSSITSDASSFAKVKYSLIGTELYLHQISNACGSVLRSNPSCITPLDTICEPGHPNYLYTGEFDASVTICAGEIYLFGDVELTEPGIYSNSFTSEHGCDSMVTLTLETNSIYETSFAEEICVGDTLDFGALALTEAGTYVEIFPTILGCDSTVTLELTVHEINTDLSIEGWIITAEDLVDATYSWVDCDDAYAPIIPIEDGITYTAIDNGNFAVIIEQDGCVDTSACITISDAEINENTFGANISIHPNPTKDIVHVLIDEQWDELILEIIDITGKIVVRKTIYFTEDIIVDMSAYSSGEYILTIQSDAGKKQFTIIKE
ncbi:MAG: hypothetical protein ACI8ZM_000828 [Crocinitomix sp.]|jgi:hypothetical protein